jgi:hypothetical protein
MTVVVPLVWHECGMPTDVSAEVMLAALALARSSSQRGTRCRLGEVLRRDASLGHSNRRAMRSALGPGPRRQARWTESSNTRLYLIPRL